MLGLYPTVVLKLTLRHKTDFTDRAAASAASAASALGSMISKHDSKANEDKYMNLQKIPVYKKMWADNIVHITPNKYSCIVYKKCDCEKMLG